MNNNVARAIETLQQGKMILLTDNFDRENEADLIFPAENITPEVMNFMIRQGTGIVCVALPKAHLQRLDLALMVAPENNDTQHGTPFTIPVDAHDGITTGVSAFDRVKTIQVLMDKNATTKDLVRPGHIYPLQARTGGVLERAGHTEGSIDIVRLAGFQPAAVICEVMEEDGSMRRGESLQKFAKEHDLPILSIQELIEYRLFHENQIQEKAGTKIHLAEYGEFAMTVIKEKHFSLEHTLLFKKPLNLEKPPLVRIHSACTTGDIFRSTHCDCHDQLHHALKRISEEGGLLIYLDQEGRGIGLLNKIKTYELQQQGFDTVEANEKLGLPVDLRKYYIPAQVLREMGFDAIRLLTNNPSKVASLEKIIQVTRESMPTFLHACNKNYLLTKKIKLAHAINL
ncbi:MAG: ribBA [Gammaproteobacteria bacterium]|jgi:3,4-dihydroxy 2-butanone 4-phosphate synthase/GTP cyclohydrolase II|nr:ribBA [Gammaproteobacteria bacterium]